MTKDPKRAAIDIGDTVLKAIRKYFKGLEFLPPQVRIDSGPNGRYKFQIIVEARAKK
jgi:hypothetical protein